MTLQEIDEWLAKTWEDQLLSRRERQELTALVAALGPEIDRGVIQTRAFEMARAALKQTDDQQVLTWLENVLKGLREVRETSVQPLVAEVYFAPGDDCPRAIERHLKCARKSADVCVFTITDDRLADALLDIHRQGVALRIITDNDKSEDLGSDIDRFERAGIPLCVDRSPFHMHHKFAVIDEQILLTGSYNWTRGASRDNEENLIVTSDPRFVFPFRETFNHLWKKFLS